MAKRKLSPKLKELIKEKEHLKAELDSLDVWWKAFVPKYREDLVRVSTGLERNFHEIYFECIRLAK